MGNNNYSIQHSPMKITKKKFIWTIENFSAREQETGECLKSGEFASFSPSGNRLKWKLIIYPNGFKEEAKEYVSIFIRFIDSEASETHQVSAKAEFYIRDSKGVDLVREDSICYCNFIKNGCGWGLSKFIKRDLLLNEANCPRDLLKVFCKISVRSEMDEIIGSKEKVDFKVPACRMMEDINKMFEENLHTDCIILAGDGKQFKVHKCILASQSPVFSAMFKNKLVNEVEEDSIKIEDIQSEVLGQLLRFIYSGEAQKLKEMSKELLAAANKFQLERLKMLCESHLVESLENGNVCELLILAISHSAEHLKTKAIEYIKLHGKEVKESNGWEMFTKEHLQLFV